MTRPSQRVARLAAEALLQRGVLGVDRQQPPAAARERVQHERPAGDEALLVGQREVGAGTRAWRGSPPGRPRRRSR